MPGLCGSSFSFFRICAETMIRNEWPMPNDKGPIKAQVRNWAIPMKSAVFAADSQGRGREASELNAPWETRVARSGVRAYRLNGGGGQPSARRHGKQLRMASFLSRSVHAFDNVLFHRAEGADLGYAVPSVGCSRFAADGFVTFEEARHEKLFREGGQFHPAPFAVVFQFGRVVGIDDAQDGARLGGVVGDGEIVLGPQRYTGGQAHQCVAVSGIKTDAIFEHLLDDEAHVLRRHGGATAKDATNARAVEINFLAERFEELGCGEEPADLAVLEDGDRLVHDMVHVGAGLVELFVGNHLFDPARIEIDEITGTPAEVGEMLDGQTQTPRAGGSDHEPGAVAREMFVGNFAREFLVIDLVIRPADALLGHAGGATGFKDVKGAAMV